MHCLIRETLGVFMKLNLILLSFFIVSLVGCGPMRGVDGTPYVAPYKITKSYLSYKYYVTKEDYEKHKSSYENVENDYDEIAGKNVVDFIVVDELPKTLGPGEFTVEIVDLNNEDSYGAKCSGFTGCYAGNTSVSFRSGDGPISQYKSGHIYIDNYTSLVSYKYEYTLLHEMGHSLGFDHIRDEISFMNPSASLSYYGFSNHDEERIAALFEIKRFFKDLERMGANREGSQIDELRDHLVEDFGLSEQRSHEVARVLHSFNQVQEKRVLTNKERNILSKKLFGTDFIKGKQALENHIQGDSSSYEDLLQKAAELNGISPEDISAMASEYLL